MKVKLPIYFNTDQTQVLQEQDIDFNLDQCIIRTITFYQITGIVEYFENRLEYSQIFTSCGSFYSPLKVKEIEYMIDKQKQLEFIQ